MSTIETQEAARRAGALLNLTLAVRAAVALQDTTAGDQAVYLTVRVGRRALEVRASDFPPTVVLTENERVVRELELAPPGLARERAENAVNWVAHARPDPPAGGGPDDPHG